MSKVKICGLSREEDIYVVNRALPDYIGFVFAPSTRRVTVKTAAMLKAKLDPRIQAVGVFVNAEISVIAEIYREGVIDLAQLHGDEDGEYISRLKELCGRRVIKAVGVGDRLPALPAGPDYYMFDTLSVQHGGIGKSFNWEILNKYNGPPYFLAGGLTVNNVADAIRRLSPYCVDVSGGVETNGVKDADKINEFIQKVRAISF